MGPGEIHRTVRGPTRKVIDKEKTDTKSQLGFSLGSETLLTPEPGPPPHRL